MIKKSRFSDPLPEIILKGKKDTTWRINDDKDICLGDTLSLCKNDYTEFAKDTVIWVKETTFGELTKEDKEGHEKFISEKELYNAYSKYYSMKVSPDTPLKVIKFRLL